MRFAIAYYGCLDSEGICLHFLKGALATVLRECGDCGRYEYCKKNAEDLKEIAVTEGEYHLNREGDYQDLYDRVGEILCKSAGETLFLLATERVASVLISGGCCLFAC